MNRESWRSRLGAVGIALGFSMMAATAAIADPAPADPAPAAAPAPKKPAARTVADPNIDVDDLKLLVEPLTKAELEIEADAWFGLLRAKVAEISDAELAVRRKNREIAALKQVKAAAQKVADASSKAEQQADTDPDSEAAKAAAAKLAEANAKLAKSVEDSKKAAATAPSATAPAAKAPAAAAGAADKEILKRAVETAQKTAAKTGDQTVVAEKVAAANKESAATKEVTTLAAQTPAANGQTTAAPAAAGAAEPKAETLAAKTDKAAAAKSDVKVQLVDYSTKLGAERTAIVDRLKVVLDELDLVGGDSKAIRAYIAAVTGLKVEVSDYVATVARLKSWLTADEGGMRWARNFGLFFAYLIGSVILAKIVRAVLGRSMGMAAATSQLLRKFVIDMSGRAVIALGLLAGLSALEINLAPLLAVIGAAGFVVAFALQGTLSNLASGLLIMVNKPFDIGDQVEVGGDIKGSVEAVSIFSTMIITEEKTRKIVPNNTIWGGVIVNHTTGAATPAHPTIL